MRVNDTSDAELDGMMAKVLTDDEKRDALLKSLVGPDYAEPAGTDTSDVYMMDEYGEDVILEGLDEDLMGNWHGRNE